MYTVLPSAVYSPRMSLNLNANFYGRRHTNTTPMCTHSGEVLAIRSELTSLKDMLAQLTSKVEEVCQQQSDVYQRLSGVEILSEDLLCKYQDLKATVGRNAEQHTTVKERLPRALSVSIIICYKIIQTMQHF